MWAQMKINFRSCSRNRYICRTKFKYLTLIKGQWTGSSIIEINFIQATTWSFRDRNLELVYWSEKIKLPIPPYLPTFQSTRSFSSELHNVPLPKCIMLFSIPFQTWIVYEQNILGIPPLKIERQQFDNARCKRTKLKEWIKIRDKQ